jgi:hypothetical protein
MDFKSFFSKDSISSPQDKKQQMLIIVLVAVVLITLIVLGFGLRRPSPPPTDLAPSADSVAFQPVDSGPVINRMRIEKIIEKIDFDIDFLRTPRFQNLKVYGEWSLEINEKGRQNPFLPY